MGTSDIVGKGEWAAFSWASIGFFTAIDTLFHVLEQFWRDVHFGLRDSCRSSPRRRLAATAPFQGSRTAVESHVMVKASNDGTAHPLYPLLAHTAIEGTNRY